MYHYEFRDGEIVFATHKTKHTVQQLKQIEPTLAEDGKSLIFHMPELVDYTYDLYFFGQAEVDSYLQNLPNAVIESMDLAPANVVQRAQELKGQINSKAEFEERLNTKTELEILRETVDQLVLASLTGGGGL